MTIDIGLTSATHRGALGLAMMLIAAALGVSARPAPQPPPVKFEPPIYAYDVHSCIATTAKTDLAVLESPSGSSLHTSFHVYDRHRRRIANTFHQFTGKERDAETGLDYFGARYYAAPMGRFTSPDRPLRDQFGSDPQSWNLYSYVRNNPLRHIDPSGLACVTLDGGGIGDDGKGERCSDTSLNSIHGINVNSNGTSQVTVNGPYPIGPSADGIRSAPDELLLGASLGKGLSEGLRRLTAMAGRKSATEALVYGSGGAISRSTLLAARSGGGPTVRLFTRLTQAPQARRKLSTSAGEAAEAQSAQAGAAHGQTALYVADVPVALLKLMEPIGLVRVTQTAMGRAVVVEYMFVPNAAEFVVDFFRLVP